MTRISPIEQSSIEELRLNMPKVKIFTVTVSHYEDLGSLPGVVKDLKNIKGLLLDQGRHGIYPRSQLTELTNPTVEQARQTIVDYAYSRSATGDILLFYFSGHGCVIGGNTFGFCMRDSKIRRGAILPLSVLSFREIVQTLSVADVHPIFVIDACFSGATASTFFPGVSAVMLDQLQVVLASSYGLLCSSSADTLSIETTDGSVFTKAICNIVSQGLSGQQERLWPFLTLKSIAQPLSKILEQEGHSLSRCYIGPDLPAIPIARNAAFNPQFIEFSPYMRRAIEFIWNEGESREITRGELDDAIGKGLYGNHSKLGYKPWRLLEDGENSRTRKLTKRGQKFAQGEIKIPKRIIRDYVSWEWVADPESELISIADVEPRRNPRRADQKKSKQKASS